MVVQTLNLIKQSIGWMRQRVGARGQCRIYLGQGPGPGWNSVPSSLKSKRAVTRVSLTAWGPGTRLRAVARSRGKAPGAGGGGGSRGGSRYGPIRPRPPLLTAKLCKISPFLGYIIHSAPLFTNLDTRPPLFTNPGSATDCEAPGS